MNSYLFEKYNIVKSPAVFLGYKRVEAETANEAKASLMESLGEGFNVCQVYTNDADPYAR